ncbi:MAG: heparan-alpha-glucosaminide N-acetyltransferase [Candidatus Peribacteraceae bacterium]|nr:heparan-alpha-glucosaminide N-acetyltransferase [Candidatus Peribacteraceae bacterium]
MDPRSKRYLEIDVLRTAALAMMVAYHAAYDLSQFHGIAIDVLTGPWHMLQLATANLFLLLVGASFAISHHRTLMAGISGKALFKKYAKRGIFLFLWGMAVSAVTFLIFGDAYVRFGILHLIGIALLLLPFLAPLQEGNALLALSAFWLGGRMRSIEGAPAFLLPLGITSPAFTSVDYYPLLPWLSPILLGFALGNLLYSRGILRHHVPQNRLTELLALPGRHSLFLYLIHQPILIAVLWIVFS